MTASHRFARMRAWLIVALLGFSLTAWAQDPLLWLANGRPNAQAQEAVQWLGQARSEGLDPEDYEARELQAEVDALSAAPDPQRGAALDARLNLAMQRYLADLHFGRIDPRSIHEHFSPGPRPAFDPAEALKAAVQGQRLGEAVRQAMPVPMAYRGLRQALAQYRALAGHPAWREPLPPLAGRKLSPGQPYAGLALLAERLAALGDLAPGTPVGTRYEGALVAAVQAFQARHALAQDGVIGKATLASLNTPPAARVRQLELTMERLRWTPLLRDERMIVINIPEFVLRAYETDGNEVDVKATMRVIVGKALDTRTPVFDEAMRFIEFSPYWNVPPSIARKETVPRLRRDPGHFHDQGFEFVAPGGQVFTNLSPAHLDAVMRGALRIRQRPGPKNALGDIKFVFPNSENIYLHHTPGQHLFGRDRRDFSHGCIRVEDPVALAGFVLKNQAGWDEERIRAAMDKGESSTLRLSQPVRVLIAYGTAVVKRDGRVHFFDDIYGHDQALDEALRLRRPFGAESYRRLVATP